MLPRRCFPDLASLAERTAVSPMSTTDPWAADLRCASRLMLLDEKKVHMLDWRTVAPLLVKIQRKDWGSAADPRIRLGWLQRPILRQCCRSSLKDWDSPAAKSLAMPPLPLDERVQEHLTVVSNGDVGLKPEVCQMWLLTAFHCRAALLSSSAARILVWCGAISFSAVSLHPPFGTTRALHSLGNNPDRTRHEPAPR